MTATMTETEGLPHGLTGRACMTCGARLMRSRVWYAMTVEQRADARARGFHAAHAKGLCQLCYDRAKTAARQSGPPRPRRAPRAREDVVEVFQQTSSYLKPVERYQQVADRLDMGRDSVERAILRARARGEC